MTVSVEAKQQYVKAIEAIWQGSMQNNNVDAISSNVINLMDEVLSQISNCSKRFATIDQTYSWYYNIQGSWADILVQAANNSASVENWISALRQHILYAACVNIPALNYKSPVQVALYGI